MMSLNAVVLLNSYIFDLDEKNKRKRLSPISDSMIDYRVLFKFLMVYDMDFL